MRLMQLFQSRVQLPHGLERTLEAWHTLPEPDLGAPSRRGRWVVVDCETSGLDPRRDRLLALGAVRIEGGLIALEQSFASGLLPPTVSEHANILVHGIGEAAQRSGAQPQSVLADFLRFAGKDVLVAFHAPFDATVLRRAMREHLGVRLSSTWLDVEALARCVFPEAPARGWGLDEWLHHLRIRGHDRHSALADAFSTAQLFLAVLARAEQRGASDAHSLLELERAARALWRLG
jgi:DNA polymerase III subunit epsilon